jgi:hypothetical protein
MAPDPLMIAAWIAAEILRWTSGEGCARTTLQAATRTVRELARDESIIIRRRRNSPCDRDYLYHSFMDTPLVAHFKNTRKNLQEWKNKIYALWPIINNVTRSHLRCSAVAQSDESTLK